MSFTSNLKDDVLNHVFRNTPYTQPATVYVGLFTSTGEVSASSYTRELITFATPVGNTIKNDAEVRFPIAVEDWGEVTSAGIFDAETAGNRLDNADIALSKSVRANDQFVIMTENYSISLG